MMTDEELEAFFSRRNKETPIEKEDLNTKPSEWINNYCLLRCPFPNNEDKFNALIAYLDRLYEIKNNQKYDEQVAGWERFNFGPPP